MFQPTAAVIYDALSSTIALALAKYLFLLRPATVVMPNAAEIGNGATRPADMADGKMNERGDPQPPDAAAVACA